MAKLKVRVGGKSQTVALTSISFLILALMVVFGKLKIANVSLDPNAQPVLQLEEVKPSPANSVQGVQNEQARVVRVIDGDTIELEGGQKLRYIGIDTPESTTQHECFGEESSQKNKELVLEKMVRLEKDVSEIDRYGRLLRYVYVEDVMINEYLVREGFAQASAYPPDVKYQEKLDEAERQARDEKKGLWGGCAIN